MLVARLAALVVLAWGLGCVQRMKEAVAPEAPTGGGTLTCREIVEQCDAQCQDPMCVRRCGDQGTPEAAAQHNAVVDCAQANGCLDEPCIREHCAAEADVCQGPEPAEPAGQPIETEPPPADAGAAPGA